MIRRSAYSATVLTAALVLSACGGGGDDAAAPAGEPQAGRLSVVASFYPLAYAVERVGGDRVEVTNLTGAGADPHHLELAPRQVGTVKDADLVVYEKGMQPAADTAIESASPARALDLASLATLSAEVTQTIGEPADDHDHAHDHDHDHDHDHGPNDPHFWLDPQIYAQAVTKIADELSAVDAAGAETYEANAARFMSEVQQVDEEFKAGLANCTQKNLVTGHTSFAYLAERYGLNQVGVAGVLNDAEPDPARIAAIADFAKRNKITTLYAEEGESATVLETVAREAGATTAALDSLSITKDGGYAARMKANLETLRAGQGCS